MQVSDACGLLLILVNNNIIINLVPPLEKLHEVLLPVSNKWLELGRVLGINDCEYDWAMFPSTHAKCLEGMLRLWLGHIYDPLGRYPSWNVMADALRKLDLSHVADEIYRITSYPLLVHWIPAQC